MDSKYQKLNIIIGWLTFAIATTVFLLTIEPTASFWDCGEYIATAYKLEVGHPPGAPFFQLLGRAFSMFVAPDKVGMMINAMSALSSSFTILFLFWSITAIAKKLALKTGELTSGKIYAVMGSGLVGGLAYTFSDSFWFSAVEGEVYAMSSFFTALVFWAILKWESVANEKHSIRWIVFIAYMIGLSIGVHLLNLLAIPAIVFIYYFKKYPNPTRKGIIITGFISVAVLGIVQNGIIPGIVSLAAKFELLFVNSLGMPFNSGMIVYSLLLLGGIIFGLYYTHQKSKPILNTVILSFLVLIIGYSSFFVLVIRSQANTPIDENNPENPINLLSYLNREQYGDWPLLRGQYYNAPVDNENPYKDGNPVYVKDETAGKYIISDDRKNSGYNYDKKFVTFFPRMYSSQPNHISGYKSWGNVKGEPIKTVNNRGEQETIMKPTFAENLNFFFRYQVGYMYLRYFMWNFVGRQNDNQGQNGNVIDGNWISGITAIDALRLGDQSVLPESLTRNKGMNKFYFFPLILGLLGVFFHFKKDPADALVVSLLFLFTGLAIIIYLNPTPYQPRERDYAYAGSYYAFAIWIGLGVYAIYDFLAKKMSGALSAILSTTLCLLCVPSLMAKEGWNDHDRSDRYTARDFAKNYLNSCAKNAILFTNGDNDTFPLWYVQEVEGYRTDVRVVNLSLLSTDWYIDQVKRKAYDSDAVPFSLKESQYRQGTRDYLPVYEQKNLEGNVDVKQIVDFISSDSEQAKAQLQAGKSINYLPTKKFRLMVDSAKVVSNGTVPRELADSVLPYIDWEINKSYIVKSEIMILDLLAHNNWERPIYFAITTGNDAYMGLENYFQLEGLAYRLVPVKNESADGQVGRIDTKIMYDNLMNKFAWGGMENPKIWMDENNLRMTMNFRNNFYRLADALLKEGKKKEAKDVLERGLKVMPEETVPFNYFVSPFAEVYYKLNETKKANAIIKKISDLYVQDLKYYASLDNKSAKTIPSEIEQAMRIMGQMMYYLNSFNQKAEMEALQAKLKALPVGKSGVYKENSQKYLNFGV